VYTAWRIKKNPERGQRPKPGLLCSLIPNFSTKKTLSLSLPLNTSYPAPIGAGATPQTPVPAAHVLTSLGWVGDLGKVGDHFSPPCPGLFGRSRLRTYRSELDPSAGVGGNPAIACRSLRSLPLRFSLSLSQGALCWLIPGLPHSW
jgi:hypothetical protein